MNEKRVKTEETEILSADEEKIRQLCSGLRHVSAPKDFDLHLKAKISAFQNKSERSPIFAFLRYAAPLSLVLALLGFLVSTNLFTIDNAPVPPVAANAGQNSGIEEIYLPSSEDPMPILASNNGPSENFVESAERTVNINSVVSQSISTGNRNSERVPVSQRKELMSKDSSESRDMASSQGIVITPQNFNANRISVSPNTFSSPASFSVKNILWEIGIEANFSGNGWKIQAVRANSLAERAGIKANDFIEAIEGLNILKETVQTNTISGRKLIIVRDGTRIEIDLR